IRLFSQRNPGIASLLRGVMKQKTVLVLLSWFSASAIFLGQAHGQGAAAPFPPCVPAAPQAAQAGGGRGAGVAGQAQAGQAARGPAQPIPRGVTITQIPGVVASGAKWTKVWQAGGNSADGNLAEK